MGRGFLVASTTDPREALTAEHLAFLDRIGAHLVRIVPAGQEKEAIDVTDVDDVYLPHFASAGHIGAVVRPDHYVFGTASTPGDLAHLVDELARMLGTDDCAPYKSRKPGLAAAAADGDA